MESRGAIEALHDAVPNVKDSSDGACQQATLPRAVRRAPHAAISPSALVATVFSLNRRASISDWMRHLGIKTAADKPAHERDERFRLWPEDLTMGDDGKDVLGLRFVVGQDADQSAVSEVVTDMEMIKISNPGTTETSLAEKIAVVG